MGSAVVPRFSAGNWLAGLAVGAALVCCPAGATATTVQGTVADASGVPLASGKIILRLSQEGTVTDPALLLMQPPVVCSISNGAIAAGCTVRGNDTISPAGMFYKVRVITDAGQELLPERRYFITGASFDLGAATPLASETVAAQAYQLVQDEGVNVPQRQALNFTGAGVTCADDDAAARTNCAVGGGGGTDQTVREADGTPSVTAAIEEFDQGVGFVVTEPVAGTARIGLSNVPDSALAPILTAGKVSGAALTSLGSLPAAAGAIPTANMDPSVSLLGQTIEDAEVTSITTRSKLPSGLAYEDEANLFTAVGDLTLDNQLDIRLREQSLNGVEYLEHRAPVSLAATATFTWFSPAAGFVRSDGSGNLSAAPASGTGSCTNQFPRTLNDGGPPTCAEQAPEEFSERLAALERTLEEALARGRRQATEFAEQRSQRQIDDWWDSLLARGKLLPAFEEAYGLKTLLKRLTATDITLTFTETVKEADRSLRRQVQRPGAEVLQRFLGDLPQLVCFDDIAARARTAAARGGRLAFTEPADGKQVVGIETDQRVKALLREAAKNGNALTYAEAYRLVKEQEREEGANLRA